MNSTLQTIKNVSGHPPNDFIKNRIALTRMKAKLTQLSMKTAVRNI